MTNYARVERLGLADTLAEVGADATTLCSGWNAHDLAAHIVARDRRPDSGPGLVLPAFSGWTERVRRAVRDRYTFDELVAKIRQGAPWWSPTGPLTDAYLNTVEMFIHHEDVRRGGQDWQPRTLAEAQSRGLFTAVRRTGRMLLRRAPAAITLDVPGHGTVAAGAGGPQVHVTGEPGELMLFCFGRQQAAQVTVTGPDAAVTALRAARLGL